jgi:hypothetical protein
MGSFESCSVSLFPLNKSGEAVPSAIFVHISLIVALQNFRLPSAHGNIKQCASLPQIRFTKWRLQ